MLKRTLSSYRFFSLCTTGALGFWIYSVTTTSLDSFPFALFGMFSRMPLTFWFGWVFLSLATLSWYLSSETRRIHYLLLLCWALFLFLGPELMEVMARGQDTFGHLTGNLFYDLDAYREPWVSYSAFPGFHFFSLPLSRMTGVDHYQLARLLGLALHVVRFASMVLLGWSLVKERRTVLFFCLLLLSLLWDNQQLDPSNQNMGLTLVFMALALLLGHEHIEWRQRLLLLVVYFAAVVTHPLSAMVIALEVLILVALKYVPRRFSRFPTKVATNTALLFLVVLAAWSMYSSEWVFPTAVEKIRVVFNGDLRSSLQEAGQPVAGTTPYFLMTYAFLGIILVWGLFTVFKGRFWKDPTVDKALPVLSVLALLPAQFVGIWSVRRQYLTSTPFIAWFFARESNLRGRLAILLLLFFFIFSFAMRYYAEYYDYNTRSYVRLARFVNGSVPSDATVYRGSRNQATFSSLSGIFSGPWGCDAGDLSQYGFRPGSDFQYAVISPREDQLVLLNQGSEAQEWTRQVLAAYEAGIVYSSGDDRLRMYQREPGPFVPRPEVTVPDRGEALKLPAQGLNGER